MGIKVLPPNVNESMSNFAAQGDDVILFGLSAVRNVGTNVVESIIKCRKAKGKYASFPDYLDKVEAVVCNKRTTESLIKAGAFDEMGHTRKGLTAQYEPMIDNVVAVKRKEAEGQFDLFGGMGDEQSDEPGFGLDVVFGEDEWDKTYLLAQEREMLGLYVSDHPLFGLEHVLSDKADAGISQLTGGDFGDGAVVTIGGIISGLQRKMTKQGNAWAIATVEDLVELAGVHVLPGDVPAGVHATGRGRRGVRQGAPRQAGGRAPAGRDGADDSRPVQRGHQRPRRPHHPGDPHHAADGQQAR